MSQPLRRSSYLGVAFTLAVLAMPSAAQANHAWGCYHWARSNNPVQLNIGDNVTSIWDGHLSTAVSEWNQSTVLALAEVAGGSPRKNCRPTSGRIEVCNASYGNNGWLGIAQIWASGCHITQAVTKLNDYYFNQAQYNTPAYRQFVACQEIGHDFGLDHQDEVFDNPNLGSCMDYTNDPDGGAGGASPNDPSNEHPNSHDYAELQTIYGHLDAAAFAPDEVATPAGINLDSPAEWGRLVRTLAGGRVQVFERDVEGGKIVTRVTWADPRPQD